MKRLPEEEYQLAQLTTNASVLESTYVMLNEKHQALQISEQARLANARVVSPARVPLDPVSPNKKLNLALACVVGALLSIGAALAIDYIDDTLHSADDVTALTQLPVLGHVPVVDSDTQRLVARIDQRHSGLVESYRMLRSNITFSALDAPLRSMLVTSGGMGEGKTLTACNLATVMAHDGKSVILVDTDLRRPAIHRTFGLTNETGFTSVVLGGATLDDALQSSEVPGLSVLTSGPLPPNPPEVLNSARGRQVIEAIKQRADVVIFDSPPAAALTDAQVLSSSTDGVLLVVACQETTRPIFQRAKAVLEHAGANLLGAVLNKLDPSRDGYGGYYHYYYYYYYHHADDEAGDGRRHRRRRRTKSLSDGGDGTSPTPPAAVGTVH
jgi:succinoglycan biosynthesis transport protein ExoP